PHLGVVVGKLAASRSAVPGVVELPETMALDGPPMSGQDAGFLGPAHDPLRVKIALESLAINKPDLALPLGVSPGRHQRRVGLFGALEDRHTVVGRNAWAVHHAFQRQAMTIVADGGLDA